MNLYRETGTFLHWYGSVLAVLVRARPLTTIALVLCSAGGKLANVLARLLPLKVLLLASAPGIPSYFQPFLSADQKDIGLAVLTLAAIGCFIAAPVLDAAAGKLAEAGSRKVVESANDIVLTDQRLKARGDFIAITGMTAELLFAGLFFAVLAAIDSHLCLLIFCLLAVTYAGAAFILRPAVEGAHEIAVTYIRNNLDDLLSTISVTVLVIAFLFILWPFLTDAPPLQGGRANILLAILAITFLRRTLRSLSVSVRTAVKLTRRNHEVNARLFREHRVQRPERLELKSLRQFLASQRWQKISNRELAASASAIIPTSTRWLDPSGGAQQLAVNLTRKGGRPSVCIERVFLQDQVSRLEHEEFLFRHLPRDALLAAPVLTRFTAPPFECLVLELGPNAVRPQPGEWAELYARIIETLWGCMPPDTLVRAYQASHSALHQRMSSELVGRIEFAVSGHDEEEAFSRFLAKLPQMQERLQAIPVFVNNTEIGLHNVWCDVFGRPQLVDWSGWSIQPLGVGRLPLRGNPAALDAMIERLRETRPDMPPFLNAAELLLAANCAALERAIERGRYQTAVQILGAIERGQSQLAFLDATHELPEEQVV